MMHDKIAGYLVDAAVIGVWAGVNYALFFGHVQIPEVLRDLAMRAMGIIDAALLAVLYYHRGTSSGSTRKTEILAGKRE